MREEKEADISDSDSDVDVDVDMITRLPDLILENIFLFLPTADAVVMTTVSKYWFNLWKSLTILHFSFNETTQSFENFSHCVEDSLSSLGSPEKNSIIHHFVLNMHFARERQLLDEMNSMVYISKKSTCIDDWISLLLKNYVKHLKIRISNMRYYLPTDIFSSKSFLTVNIEGCYVMGGPLFCGTYSSFNCLKELVLLRVETSNVTVHKILSYSPLLEKLVLKEISRMTSLIVRNLPRLSYLEVEQALDGRLEIKAPNLRTLILHLDGSVKGFVSDHVTVRRGNYGSKKFVFEHAMLETLQLCFNSCARIKVACSNLRTMSLSNKGSENPLDVDVDAPKLEQLDYEGYVIPSFHGMHLVKPTVTLKLSLGGRPGLDVAVRSCIEMFNQPTVHLSYLYGQFFKAQEILWPGQVQEMEVTSPPPKVKCLIWSLSSSTPSFAYQLLLDGSLCSCHPSILRVEALPANREFMKFLCHELLDREENPSCCKDEPEFRCWRHYLKSVNVQIQSQSETEKPNTFGDKALMNTLNHIDTSKEVQFNMNWSRNLV
ncbi:hypothetical protein VNO80_27995 [Phaseolus coccineus]|uniref:F-box domain-containing protein n=1 Tax=Phaseolus coccineus TaxID=3886 RepID=A0AAN9QHR7_PHACN